MINLTTGTNSVWLSIRESLPAGYTQSNYKFSFIEPLSNTTKVLYPSAVETGYKWSSFTISVGTVESLTASAPTVNLSPGLWHYIVTDTISGNELNRGILSVTASKVATPSISRTKDVRTYKR